MEGKWYAVALTGSGFNRGFEATGASLVRYSVEACVSVAVERDTEVERHRIC